MEEATSQSGSDLDLSMSISKCLVEITYDKINDAEDFDIPQEALDAAK